MKILHTCESYLPSIGGVQEVVRQLSERLAARGHEVTVATSGDARREGEHINGVRIKEFNIKGNMVNGYQGDAESYRTFLRQGGFDVMMNYAAQQWTTDLALDILDELPCRKVLVPCGFSGLRLPAYAAYYEKMKEWLAKYDACVYLSDRYRDIEFARGLGLKNGVLIPNGAATEEFSQPPAPGIRERLGIQEDHKLVLLVASHTGMKGHPEAMKIFRRSGIRNATLLIVGNDTGRGCGQKCRTMERTYKLDPLMRSRQQQIMLRELSRKDTVAAYFASDIFLFPSLVECSPLVLFEAMASGTPFLTTDVGNAAEIVDWSGGGKLLPTRKDQSGLSHAMIPQAADLLRSTLEDEPLLEKLGREGRASWEQRFTWDKITDEYEQLYSSL